MSVIVINNYYKPEHRCRARQVVAAIEKVGRKCELFDYREVDHVTKRIKRKGIETVVLSGSSADLGDSKDLMRYDEEIRFVQHVSVPLLGICFGHQLIGKAFGSEIGRLSSFLDEFKTVEIVQPNGLFSSWKQGERILLCQSHRDFVKDLPENFACLAKSKDCEIEAMKHKSLPIYGIQAHIERYSDEHNDGLQILKNFFKDIAESNFSV